MLVREPGSSSPTDGHYLQAFATTFRPASVSQTG
jgi:hypothetical protein